MKLAAATRNRKTTETSVPIVPPIELERRRNGPRGVAGRERDRGGRDDHDGRMAEREEQADGDRPLALLHQLARHVVDGRDVVGIDGVAQPECVGQERGADQHRIIVKRDQRPDPGQHIGGDQHGIDAGDLAAKFGVLIVEQSASARPHEHSGSGSKSDTTPPAMPRQAIVHGSLIGCHRPFALPSRRPAHSRLDAGSADHVAPARASPP